MPIISVVNNGAIAQLKEDVKDLPWYTRWFFPSGLLAALEAYDPSDLKSTKAWTVCHNFLEDTWFFQRWFISALRAFSASPLVQALQSIQSDLPIADDREFKAVLKHENPQFVASVINATAEIRTEAQKHATNDVSEVAKKAQQDEPIKVLSALAVLNDAGLLAENGRTDYFNASQGSETTLTKLEALTPLPTKATLSLLNKEDAQLSIAALIELEKTGNLLTDLSQDNFNLVLSTTTDKMDMVDALDLLSRMDLLTGDFGQTNWLTVSTHDNPIGMAWGITELKLAELDLDEEYRNLVSEHALPPVIARAVCALHHSGLLSTSEKEANLDKLLESPDIKGLEASLGSLDHVGILTQENFETLLENNHKKELYNIFLDLFFDDALNQDSFELVVKHQDPKGAADAYSAMVTLNLFLENAEFTEVEFNAIADQEFPQSFIDTVSALTNLLEINLIPSAFMTGLIKAPNLNHLASCFTLLNKEHLITDAMGLVNFNAVNAHPDSEQLASILLTLSNAHLLTHDNFATAVVHTNPESAANALIELNRFGLLQQENLYTIMHHPDPKAISDLLVKLQVSGAFANDEFAAANRGKLELLVNPQEAYKGFNEFIKKDKEITQADFDRITSVRFAAPAASVGTASNPHRFHKPAPAKDEAPGILTSIYNTLFGRG